MQLKEHLNRLREQFYILVHAIIYNLNIYPREWFHKHNYNNKHITFILPRETSPQLDIYIRDSIDIIISAIEQGELISICFIKRQMRPVLNRADELAVMDNNEVVYEWESEAKIQILFSEADRVRELRANGWANEDLMQHVHSSVPLDLDKFLCALSNQLLLSCSTCGDITSEEDVSFAIYIKTRSKSFADTHTLADHSIVNSIGNEVKWKLTEHIDTGLFGLSLLENNNSI